MVQLSLSPAHFFASHSRRIFAIGGIALSLFAAIALVGSTQSTTAMWAAAHQLAPGSLITPADLLKVEVTLGSSEKNYYNSTSHLLGDVVTRVVGAHELIPITALNKAGSPSDLRHLPIGIERNDLPPDLTAGEKVDLYAVSKDPGQPAALLASKIYVQSIDNRSRDLGGAVTVLFLLHDREVLAVVEALASNRMVVVRDAL